MKRISLKALNRQAMERRLARFGGTITSYRYEITTYLPEGGISKTLSTADITKAQHFVWRRMVEYDEYCNIIRTEIKT